MIGAPNAVTGYIYAGCINKNNPVRKTISGTATDFLTKFATFIEENLSQIFLCFITTFYLI